jgi:hypothetical protein
VAAPVRQEVAPAEAELRALVRTAARQELHRRGDLDWLLDSNQFGIAQQFDASTGGRWVLECSRRLGKTHLLGWLARRLMQRHPGCRIVYGGPTIDAVVTLLLPALLELERDAPPEWRHHFDGDKTITYPGAPGSRIHIFGCDNKRSADRGRGPSADLVLIDEAGFIPILGYAMRDVLRPQTLTTGARMVLASSPAAEPGHEFTRIAEAAEVTGNYVNRTIHDNPRLTPERIAEYIAEDANDEGMTVEEYILTDTFQREYLAKRVVDRTLTGIPEWADVSGELLVERVRPAFWDAYVGLDYGGADPHAALFAYLDFERQVLVVEDEVLLRDGENTAQLAEAIQEKERALWGVSLWEGTLRSRLEEEAQEAVVMPGYEGNVSPQPYQRVADHDVQLTRDLQSLHGIAFVPAAKGDKEHRINRLRVAFRKLKIEVHPRCRNLNRHLRTTVWKDGKRAEWKRKNGEHGDLVDALDYLYGSVDWTRNPWPRVYASRREPQRPTAAQGLARALGRR